ncbi:hypothetical protein POM88_013569 [Heracleum sosnowskyi]|uniref:CCHC-type domain-containing protein n=1 Tax=Heracleum sosnowskyi TaxID=360622 RepID=A0AAD8J0T1_9APIA|nr:hypothetical protein POM88_013569 [Heracleum sosnowskyi]
MASQSPTAQESMQLISDTVRNDDESIKVSSFNVSENVQNGTQIDDTIEALKDDHDVCISTDEIEKNGLIEAVDHKELMLLSSNAALMRSKDEEANQDLSLKILEKAENTTQIDDIIEAAKVLKDDKSVSTQIDNVIEAAEVLKDDKSVSTQIDDVIEAAEVLKDKSASTQIDNVMEAAEVPKDDNCVSILSGLKEEIEKTDWIKAGDDHSVIVDEKIKETGGCDSQENIKSIEDKIEISDNIVMRKLLRGPRYFDLLDSGRGSCYNCGEEGHTAVRCTMAKRKKPCFVCGSLEHNAKQCAKGQDCFICKKGGHRAKDCPEKKMAGLHLSAKICLKCGQSGHEMFSCQTSYSSDDLKEIQCYMCKNFGHLCCATYTPTVGGKLSCYRCGQSGHTGLACKISRGGPNEIESPSSCYKCGEGGHFARECTNLAKPYTRLPGGPKKMESPSTCYKCGQGGHFARECSDSVKPYTRLPGRPNKMDSPSTCYKCGQGGHFARECSDLVKAATKFLGGPTQMESPSSCYKCGGEGHFARECSNSPMASTRLQGGLFEMESISSCYRCGGEGHFARECTSSVEAHTRLHEYPNCSGSTSLCYKCGERGHFARECTTSAKSLKRNRELSSPKFKLSKHKKDSSDRKSWPSDLGKPRKRKKTQYEGEFSTPVKSKRGGWTTEHPRDLHRQKARNRGLKSPATPSTRNFCSAIILRISYPQLADFTDAN